MDTQPIHIKNYRIPHSHKEEIDKAVKKLIKDKIVPKKSEGKRWRLVRDYRQIKKKLIADKFPLPRIDVMRSQKN